MASDNDLNVEIQQQVAKQRDEMVKMLQEIVRFASYTATEDEKKLVDRVEQILKEDGFETKRVPIGKGKGKPGWSPPAPKDVDLSERHCVMASLPGKDAKAHSVTFNAHLDVVPVEESPDDGVWTTEAFGGEVKDGRLYGRGSGDMKGGLVAVIMAIRALKRLDLLPLGRICVHCVLEEESTGNGAAAVVQQWKEENKESLHGPTDAVIIPEPLPGILQAQLGVIWGKVEVFGTPAHVLDTGKGFNAIQACIALYEAASKTVLSRWNQDAASHPAFKNISNPIHFNIGKIHGGAWASSVPSRCTAEFRAGFLPGVSPSDAQQQIAAAFADAASSLSAQHKLSFDEGFHAEGFYDADLPTSEFGQALSEAHQDVTGSKANFTSATCTTDARFYNLYSKIPSTCYGPESTHIHGIDESVSLSSIDDISCALALFLVNYCNSSN